MNEEPMTWGTLMRNFKHDLVMGFLACCLFAFVIFMYWFLTAVLGVRI